MEKVEELQRLSSMHQIIWQPAEKLWITADRERLGQVLTTFISNAIKYSPDGGGITISCLTDKKEITISVQDKSLGIPEEVQHRVFDRFYQIQWAPAQTFPGLGSGLYITGGIIHQHGGTVKVKSSVSKGSTFTFTLPQIQQ